jgi:hypothetical protein
MKRKRRPRETASERAYVRSLETCSTLDLLDQGRAKLLTPAQYPAPLKRFLARERTMVHIKLPAQTKRRLEARSRRTGIPVEELALRWIEQGMARDAG